MKADKSSSDSASETFEYCDCLSKDNYFICGCGGHHAATQVRPEGREQDFCSEYIEAIHWRGGHWLFECAFKVALTENQILKQALTYNEKNPHSPVKYVWAICDNASSASPANIEYLEEQD